MILLSKEELEFIIKRYLENTHKLNVNRIEFVDENGDDLDLSFVRIDGELEVRP